MPICELCRCEVNEVTTHHLIPRSRHKKKKTDLTRDDFKGRPVDLCRSCHKEVHMMTDNEVELYF